MLQPAHDDPLAALSRAVAREDLQGVSHAARALLRSGGRLGSRWSEVAGILNETGDVACLIDVCKKLTEEVPSDPQSFVWLASAYTQGGAHRSALQTLQPLLAASPRDPGLNRRVGRILLDMGLNNEAQVLFRTALGADSLDALAWEGLAKARTFTREDDDLAALEQARVSANEAVSARDRGILSYALAKAYDDLGEYELAARRVTEAAAFYRMAAPFNMDQHREGVRRILEVYDAGFTGANEEAGLIDSRPVFIMAPPACGASWLAGILSSENDVGALQRSNALFWMSASPLGDQTRDHIQAALSAPREDNVLTGVGMSYLGYARELLGDVRRWIDPTSLGEMAGGAIGLCLPAARFVRIRREPLDQAWAILKTRFLRARFWTYHPDDIAQTLALHNQLMDRWEALFPDRILNVAYEDLANDTENEVRRIAFFAGVDADEAARAADAARPRLLADPPGVHERAGSRITPVREALTRAGFTLS
ncbi:MAG: tetratricopeptide repeat-containing sulfotransferase family protein [Caulobacterales bacterium]|uniref:tetratricopeptide repeat-containing sulfotransferase family protein n=1 Tax=Glycocaulis sp. TaxID=1969725 RepID=UPI003F9EEAB9